MFILNVISNINHDEFLLYMVMQSIVLKIILVLALQIIFICYDQLLHHDKSSTARPHDEEAATDRYKKLTRMSILHKNQLINKRHVVRFVVT